MCASSCSPSSPPFAAAPSQDELQQAADRVVAKSDMPAVVTLFEQDGVRHIAAAGLANVKTRRKAQPSDRTRVGSITKSSRLR